MNEAPNHGALSGCLSSFRSLITMPGLMQQPGLGAPHKCSLGMVEDSNAHLCSRERACGFALKDLCSVPLNWAPSTLATHGWTHYHHHRRDGRNKNPSSNHCPRANVLSDTERGPFQNRERVAFIPSIIQELVKTASPVVPPPPKANTPQQSKVSLCWGQCGGARMVLIRKWAQSVPSLAQARIHQGLSFQSVK